MDLLLGVDVDPLLERDRWLARLQEARRIAAGHQEIAAATMKERFDKNHSPSDLRVGDHVYVKETRVPPGKSAKLRPKASSVIYEITKLSGGNGKSASIQSILRKSDQRHVHIDRLKKVQEEPKNLFGEPDVVVHEDPNHFEVDRVLESRQRSDGSMEYLIRWLGYGPDDDKWVGAADLNAPKVLERFKLDQAAKATSQKTYADAVKTQPKRKAKKV